MSRKLLCNPLCITGLLSLVFTLTICHESRTTRAEDIDVPPETNILTLSERMPPRIVEQPTSPTIDMAAFRPRDTAVGRVICRRLVPLGARLIDFESFPATDPRHPLPPDFLAACGIAEISVQSESPASGVLIGDVSTHKVVKATPTSGKRFFVQTSPNPDAHSVTLTFNPPLDHFGFSRIGTSSGSSTPRWKAEAFDEQGQLIESHEEGFVVSDIPRTFDFFAPFGRVIRSVKITSTNNSAPGAFAWSSFESVPLDDFVLTTSRQR